MWNYFLEPARLLSPLPSFSHILQICNISSGVMPWHTDCENKDNLRHKRARVIVTFVTILSGYARAAFQRTVWWLSMKRYLLYIVPFLLRGLRCTTKGFLQNSDTKLCLTGTTLQDKNDLCHIFPLKTKQTKKKSNFLMFVWFFLYFKGAVCKKN